MRRFLQPSAPIYTELERRAQGKCVVYYGELLPPGCQPGRGRVGFEVDPRTGAAQLLVEKGVLYSGPHESVQAWLATGRRSFAHFQDLRMWVGTELAAAYENVLQPVVELERAALPAAPEMPALHVAVSEATLRALERGQVVDEAALYAALRVRVRGQEVALRTLTRRVRRHIGRSHHRRPLTVFAVGPTGVGKTKTAESLPTALRAAAPDAAGYAYLRLDMAEYQERHRVSQLFGAPPGYVGYGEGTALASALAANPRTIVLFDEIEKAHPDILRSLMNAMDAGRMSSPGGRDAQSWEIDCRQAIFLFTSNLDAEGILRQLEARDGFENAAVVDSVCRAQLRATGVPAELIGRISCFLVFRPLSPAALAEIVVQAIVGVGEEYGLHITEIEPSVLEHLLLAGRRTPFGVRPFEYLVDELLGAALLEAASAPLQPAWVVQGGPPFRCIPQSGLSNGSVPTTAEGDRSSGEQ